MENVDYMRLLTSVGDALRQATKDLQAAGSQQRACQIVDGTLSYVVTMLCHGMPSSVIAGDLQRRLLALHKAAEPWTGVKE